MEEVDWVKEIILKKRKEFPGVEEKLLEQEVIRDVMGAYVLDVLEESKQRLSGLNPSCADDVRHASGMTIAMSDTMKKRDKVLREFLWSHFYRHAAVSRVRLKTFRTVQELFGAFMENRRCLPSSWLKQVENAPKGWDKKTWHARCVADYIASMTDRLAILEHRELFDTYQGMR
jgi:dGTPase